MMRYTIKEISNLLGVTTHKLRYYEKIGIIKPEVNELTGYRYFSVLDTRRFNLARLYRGMGFSMEQCLSLLKDASSDEIISKIDEQREILEKEIHFKTMCVEEMKHYTHFLKKLPNFVDSFSIIEIEEHIRIEFSDHEVITKDKSILKIRDEILQYTPLVRWVSRIPKSTLDRRSGSLDYHFGINMRLSNAKKLGIDISKYTIIPTSKYLITVFKKSANPSFGWETLEAMQNYLAERQVTQYGDGYSSCVHSTKEKDSYNNFHYFIVQLN